MKQLRYLLGLDAGISVIKVALFDKNGAEICMVSWNTTLISPQPDWAEVSMTETWEMTVAAIRELLDSTHINSSQIAGPGAVDQDFSESALTIEDLPNAISGYAPRDPGDDEFTTFE